MNPCSKRILADIPGTVGAKVELFCMYLEGHSGSHVARGTINGGEFEIVFDVGAREDRYEKGK